MKKHKPTQTPPRRTFLRSFVSALTLSAGLVSVASAADWYLKANQSSGTWASPVTDWAANPDGTGANPAAIAAPDTFDANNHVLRTPGGSSGVITFPGGTLRLSSAGSIVALKTSGTGTAVVPVLLSTGGSIETWNSGTQYFRADDLTNVSGSLAFRATSGRTLKATVTKLTGSGEALLAGGGTVLLDWTDATRYAGNVHLTLGTLNFDNDLSSAGSLVIETGTQVVLDQSVTFTGLVIGGTEYPAGTYSYATLQSAYPAIFTSGTAGGAIVVRAQQTWYLTTNQASAQNWGEDYLFNWNSAANGSGTAPTSINPFDLYLNQTSGRQIRTPVAGSTFAGGVLAVTNGATLVMKSPAGTVSTIPAFLNSNSATISNGYGTIREDLAVGDWEITSGTTKLSASSGRSLGVSIDYLTGSGGLQTLSGGSFYLSLVHGSGYTGTLNHSSGSLRFENAFSSRGAFTVASTATVNLDQPVYFTSASVAGVSLPAGINTYAALNAAYPAQFPSGSAAGLIGIYTPGAAPAPLHGVNISGPESDTGNLPGTYGYNYVYPTVADFDYYHAKGLNLIRIPFRWERMQHGLNVALDTAQLGYMDTAIARASARGMKVILDMHNYAECKVSGVKYRFGSAGLPASAYADVWRRLADHYKNEPAIYAYDIMNEPNGLAGGVWVTYAQAAINAIREVDLNHDIIVEGESWANAWGFESKNPNLHTVRDPLDRIIFSAHSYWSDAGTDVYKSYDLEAAYPEMGVHNVKPFVDWLKKHGFKGYVGEYGVPNDDPRWNVVLDNFLDYLDAEGISGTYWAGGAWYSGNPISCQPVSGVDRAVMSVLQTHP
jgi:aryl-phospho-beta-D-glucosidase BglC (GH1 family)